MHVAHKEFQIWICLTSQHFSTWPQSVFWIIFLPRVHIELHYCMIRPIFILLKNIILNLLHSVLQFFLYTGELLLLNQKKTNSV